MLVWSSKTSSIGELVTIKEVSSNEMVIETMIKEVKTIKIPSNLANIIDENKQYHDKYYIKYTTNIWGKPKLKQIKPMLEENS